MAAGAALALVVLLAAAVIALRGGSADDGAPTPATGATSDPRPEVEGHGDEHPSTPTVPGEPTDLTDALAAVEPAIERLLAEPTLRIDGRSAVDGAVETFAIDLDQASSSFASLETVGTEDGPEATVERIEVPGTQYLRVVGDDPPAAEDWSVIPIEVPEQIELPATYTLFGRITPQLDRLVAMWRAIEPEAERIEADGRVGYRLTAPTSRVAEHLATEGLAGVEPVEDEAATSTWELWLDDDGRLARLVGSGVQYFDGEALDHARIEVTYEVAPVAVGPPEL